MMSSFTLPWAHRASKKEILLYYKTFIDDMVDQKKVQYYPNCVYDFDNQPEATTASSDNNIHRFFSCPSSDEENGKKTNKTKYLVKVKVKLVNGVLGECLVPSKCPPKFHYDDNINMITPNELYALYRTKERNSNKNKNYVVIGCGKTGMDAVIYLRTVMKVSAKNIYWIISNDVWMIAREGGGTPSSWAEELLKHNCDEKLARSSLEKKGIFVRLDKNIEPTRFRFPVIGKNELVTLRQIKNTIRKGRISSINIVDDNIVVQFKNKYDNNNQQPKNDKPWTIQLPSKNGDDNEKEDAINDYVFIHCSAPGPFNTLQNVDVFTSNKEMNLQLLFAPPVTISMSCLAYLEACRYKGNLDVNVGKELLLLLDNKADNANNNTNTDNNLQEVETQILRKLIKGYTLNDPNIGDHLDPVIVFATILALANKDDPIKTLNWMKKNRLSMLSIPGAKSKIYETLSSMLKLSESTDFFSKAKIATIGILQDKLKVLKGM